jgi:spore coat protein U-like protein
MKKITSVLFLSLLLNHSNATTVTTTFPVTASVVANCIIGTISNLDFGSFGPSASPVTTGNFSVSCTNITPWTMTMNSGSTAGGTINQRLLTNHVDSNYLPYTVYRESGYTTIFGDGTTGLAITGTGTGSTQTITVYGKMLSGGNLYATPGSYSDILTLTLTY